MFCLGALFGSLVDRTIKELSDSLSSRVNEFARLDSEQHC